MNMLKKGPELKMPDLKVPDFLLDVYYDLRERHLLPLVAILLVALVALPIALSGGSSDPEAGAPEAGAAGISSAALPSSNLVVAKAAPGLRDYRRRLADRTPQDPFVQKYTGSEGAASGDGGSTESVPATSSESGSVTIESTTPESASPTSPESPSPAPASDGNGEPSDPENLRYYSFVIDVRVVPVSPSSGGKADPQVRRNLPELTMLPSRDIPALTFMTVSKDEKKVLMLVNDNVRALFGDAVCVVGTERCQLLALEPGVPETIVYGSKERTYRIELLKLHTVTTDSLDKAPLGKQRQKDK